MAPNPHIILVPSYVGEGRTNPKLMSPNPHIILVPSYVGEGRTNSKLMSPNPTSVLYPHMWVRGEIGVVTQNLTARWESKARHYPQFWPARMAGKALEGTLTNRLFFGDKPSGGEEGNGQISSHRKECNTASRVEILSFPFFPPVWPLACIAFLQNG